MDNKNSVFDGFVIVKDDKFHEVKQGTPSEYDKNQADEIINGSGKWLLPGLINSHGHLGSAFLRGAGDDIPLMTWLKTVMWPNEQKFTEEIVKNAASLAMVEMVKSGTTTFLDMYHLYMDKMAELAISSEMRTVLCRGMIGLCPDREQDEKIAESIQLFHDYNGVNKGKVTVALSPHAPYTCPPSFMIKVVDAAKKNGMWIHTHLAETKGEVDRHIAEHGVSPVKHMDDLGLFDVPSLIAHGVHLTVEDLHILCEKNVSVAHNPMSNLKLGSGIAPIPDMINKGITISLGTDSTASNNNLDLFEEMRFAALIHKGTHEDPTVTTSEMILRMATNWGAKALQLEKLGKIKAGYQADFILVNPNSAHLLPSDKKRVLSHLVYSAKGSDVTDSFVGGVHIMKDKELLSLDEEKIIFEAKAFQI